MNSPIKADSVDDLLDFLGNPSTTHTTHQSTTAPPTISNVDLFDSLSDFSIVPNANDIEDEAPVALAPDLLCDLSSDFKKADIGDNPVSLSSYEVINKDDVIDIVELDNTDQNTMKEANSLPDDNNGFEFDPIKNNDSQNKTSAVSGDIDQNEINFDVLMLPTTSDLGLDAERSKGKLAKQGSYALRRKPSRKSGSILPKDGNSIFSDSTEPKPEVIAPESEEPEDTIISEPVDDKTPVRSPPKAGFAMPGLHDLSTSKLFSKNRKISVSDEDLSPTNENKKEEEMKSKVDKAASVRVLPTLPVEEKSKLNKTGIRVLPMIPVKEKAYVSTTEDESPKEQLFEGKMTAVKSEVEEDLFNPITIDKPKIESDVQEDSEKRLFGEDNKLENCLHDNTKDKPTFKSDVKITTSIKKKDTNITSPDGSKSPSIDSVTKREKPLIINKPNRLSSTGDSKTESVSKTISDMPKIEIVTKTSVVDDKNKGDMNISSQVSHEDVFNSLESKFGEKVQLRNPKRDPSNISKRHSTNLDFRPSVPESSEKSKVQEKRSSRNFDFVPSNTVEIQKEPSWLLEMRSKKNNPVTEKNSSNRNSSQITLDNSQTEVKQPSWMSEIKARKSTRVKTDSNVCQKINQPEKPSWMKTALDKQSKVAEILDIENKHQGNGDVKERNVPEVHLRKPGVETRNITNQKELNANGNNDNKDKITPPWFSDLQLRKAPRSPMKDSPKENIEPEWKRKAEEKRARLIKSGLLDH